MNVVAAIFENDVERDRKVCVNLDLKVTGANRELAQWLLDHPTYPAPVVAEWLGCGVTRIKDLRKWAVDGFKNKPFRSGSSRARGDDELKSLDNSEKDSVTVTESDEVADAATVEDNALYTLSRITEHAKSFKKIFKLSAFDREAEQRISTAIDRMIQKWRSTQATLTKGGHDGQD